MTSIPRVIKIKQIPLWIYPAAELKPRNTAAISPVNWQQNQLSPRLSSLNRHLSPHPLNLPVVLPVLAVMNCFRGRSLLFAVRGAAHQSGGLLCSSGRDYWAFRRLHTVSHSPSDQRGTRISPHLTPGAHDFTGISTQSRLISPLHSLSADDHLEHKCTDTLIVTDLHT